jgi:hypothetical protein
MVWKNGLYLNLIGQSPQARTQYYGDLGRDLGPGLNIISGCHNFFYFFAHYHLSPVNLNFDMSEIATRAEAIYPMIS